MKNNLLNDYVKSQYKYKYNIILCNLLDKDFFNDFYKESNILKQFEEKGKKLFPFFNYLIEDLFYILYKLLITLKDKEEISLQVKSHHILIKKVLENTNINNLRRRTKGNLVYSYNALYHLLQWFFEFIKDEKIINLMEERNKILERIQDLKDKVSKEEYKKNLIEEKIERRNKSINKNKEIQKNNKDNNSIEQEEEKEQQEQSIEGKIDRIEGSGNSTEGENQDDLNSENSKEYEKGELQDSEQSIPGDGKNPSSNQKKQNNVNNSELSKFNSYELDFELISKKIQEYEEKLKQLEKDDNILLDDYEKILDQENINEITNKAIFIIEELEEKAQCFGSKTEEMKKLSFDLILDLSKTLRKPELEKILNKIGEKRTLARRGQRKRKKLYQGIQSRNTISDDLNSITEDEYINLGIGIEAFELDFYNRYLNARLSTWEGARIEKKRKGPIIVCYDGSASMEGERIEEAKAHLFAFMEIARKQKRKMLTIQFSSVEDKLFIIELEPYTENLEKKLDIIEGYIGKGTDFNKPLIKSLEFIINLGYKDADIIFMTDGESYIDENFKTDFLNYKKVYKFKMYLILINYTKKEYKDIQLISDEIYYVKGDEWEKDVSEKIFTL